MSGDSSNFRSLYERERKRIDKKISYALGKRKPASLYEPAKYILDGGGKRLRPLLVLLSAKSVGAKYNNVYNAAVAVELLHNFTLVHDDIMDNSDKRRGRLTVHKKFDVNTAILSGDSLLSVAYEYLIKDCNGNSKKVFDAFTKGLVEVCEGQSLDKEFELLKAVSLDEYIEMIRKKTAAMVEMCCRVGALIGKGTDEEIKGLAAFGRNIGIAFQIQDDLLDIYGSEFEFGKFPGGDLVEGKKTYLFLKAVSKAKGKEKDDLNRLIKNKGITKKEIPHYKELYIKLGVVEDAKNEVKRYTKKALNSINILKKAEDREIFSWLADSLIKRSK